MTVELSAPLVGAGQSVTNGWDAICAMNTDAVNALFFQQWVTANPGSAYVTLQAPIVDGTSLWLLDVGLGHPEISFSTTGTTDAAVTMYLAGGALVSIDPETQIVQSALLISPDTSWLQGAVVLKSTHGVTTATGRVYVDLAAGAWTPTISGVAPASALQTDLGTAVATFFLNNATTYELGALGPSQAPAALTPTTFTFALQPSPAGGGDGCVLILIQTTGGGGTVGPMATYPIPSGASAALYVSNQVLFQGLLATTLATQLANAGTTVSAEQSNGVWQVNTSGGSFNLGIINNPNPGPNPYPGANAYWYKNHIYPTSADNTYDANPQAVSVSASNLLTTPNPSTGAIDLSWSDSWDQVWGWDGTVAYYGYSPTGETQHMQASVTQSSSATVQDNNLITFSGSPSVSAAATSHPDWFDKFIGAAIDVPSALSAAITSQLTTLFTSLQLPDVQTFSLVNLLFPNDHALSLSQASAPCDLQATGTLQAPLVITPPQSQVAPGGTPITFTATTGSGTSVDVLWEVVSGGGTISSAGVYTPPASIPGLAQLAIIRAVDVQNAQTTGGALVLIAAGSTPTALSVAPANLLLTGGQQYLLQVTDANANPVAATCAPPTVGTLVPGFGTGQFIYTAPATLDGTQQVRIVATSTTSPADTGSATITLAPTTTVTVTPANTTVEAGGTLAVTGASPDLQEFSWIVYPQGCGTIACQGDTTNATYTAPASVTTPTTVTLIAYGLDGAAGVGVTRITVTPANP